MKNYESDKYFLEHMISLNIEVIDCFDDDYNEDIKNLNQKKIIEQIYNINEFHSKAAGYKGYAGRRLENKTGKLIEQNKVNTKKVKRYLAKLADQGPSNCFEELFLESGEQFIEIAEESIRGMFLSGYMDILRRGADRGEICLGDTDFTNLRKKDKLQIISLKNCAYNTVELDGFALFNKLRSRCESLDFKEVISDFCKIEKLNSNSEKFIQYLMLYPSNFIKCCNRYRESKKDWSADEYKSRLEKAIRKDLQISF